MDISTFFSGGMIDALGIVQGGFYLHWDRFFILQFLDKGTVLMSQCVALQAVSGISMWCLAGVAVVVVV